MGIQDAPSPRIGLQPTRGRRISVKLRTASPKHCRFFDSSGIKLGASCPEPDWMDWGHLLNLTVPNKYVLTRSAQMLIHTGISL